MFFHTPAPLAAVCAGGGGGWAEERSGTLPPLRILMNLLSMSNQKGAPMLSATRVKNNPSRCAPHQESLLELSCISAMSALQVGSRSPNNSFSDTVRACCSTFNTVLLSGFCGSEYSTSGVAPSRCSAWARAWAASTTALRTAWLTHSALPMRKVSALVESVIASAMIQIHSVVLRL